MNKNLKSFLFTIAIATAVIVFVESFKPKEEK